MTHSRWQPTASIENQRLRAQSLKNIRQFFAERKVMEVETPILSQHTVTDIYIDSFQTTYLNGKKKQNYYLQTSPEYAMKRLLSAGSGPIYQICKAFRNGESGSQHNPEFSILEWYRPNFSCHDLMDEMDELLQFILQSKKASRITYEELFLKHLGINPHQTSLHQLQSLANQFSLENSNEYSDRNTLLQFLFSEHLEPKIGFDAPLFVYHFPATQAALSKINPQDPNIALRFEVYIQGMECANGFEELTNADEQRQRFLNDNKKRNQQNRPSINIEKRFLDALTHGLPPCAGVAVGLDRLIMMKSERKCIDDVINFPWERA
ncbi:elongation factor P--(R)-beta-lysine ligase [Coxiella endosymbiont of Ornithodoros maritimus]|uniref:elongation factor P--(R)-beta-lysine ligase n=1 Tax=Coxiella endosymbiont of Ornithodoros maritimus TaxID=1656172 RepID=UPI002264D02C|nr:elongation factor P--(R)-beta-lysine ligase [Coxiella endosymbiont of Ornithodoros maritimus]